jgi:hypothetical protein
LLAAKIRAWHFENELRLKCWRAFVGNWKKQKNKNRVKAYTRNIIHRKRAKLLFDAWKTHAHTKMLAKLKEREVAGFEREASKELAYFDKRCEALNLYITQLRQKIEDTERETDELTVTYERSLNKGLG